MDKQLIIIGIMTMGIGVGFLAYNFVEVTEDTFWIGTGIWTVGAIATILGLTVFTKERGLHIR